MSVTGLAGMLNLRHLTPELIPPAEIFAGTITPFRLLVHNRKRHLPSFLIHLECPEGQGVTLPVVPRGGTAEGIVGIMFAGRGRGDIGRITVSSPFPVNFFTRYWIFSLDATCTVFPRLLPVVSAGDGGARQRSWGDTARRQRGIDGELERIALYTGGEPLRMIHWKLSARGDELHVKEFGRQGAMPLIIDLGAQPGGTLEERISQAAWLVRRWAGERPVGLRLDGRTIPAGTGQRHALHLLKELALHGIA